MITFERTKEIMGQPFITVKDIEELMGCKKTKAFEFKREIIFNAKRKNKKIYDERYIPTSIFVDWAENDTFTRVYEAQFKLL